MGRQQETKRLPIHVFHGVLADWSVDSRLDRLYVPTVAFSGFLDRLTSRYVPAESCGPDDIALTIDDSTMAAAEAALLARGRGHDVTLFLNPHQIIAQTPYFFTILGIAIDRLVERARKTDPRASWRSPHFLQLRQETRAQIAALDGPALDGAMRAFLERWDLDWPDVPAGVRAIDPQTLSRLTSAGVQIGNHGWSHTDIAAMSPDQLWNDISMAQRWLEDATSQRITSYAVPFGLVTPPPEVLTRLPGTCMLVDGTRPVGPLAPDLVNRLDITDDIVARARLRQPWFGAVPRSQPERRGWRVAMKQLLRGGRSRRG